eukprot:TRINITY_DN64653_c1_g1_i1.p1 TRINITY_DN64653_c1_g1~~TRINITY_DN64653_c1_g1_i1.p1  ORF type:complete len:379 (-),score=39.92 TRINITY_DN64653_c1_g1_i1:2182-3162(-)
MEIPVEPIEVSITVTPESFVEEVMELEEKYMQFFLPRNLAWCLSQDGREQWKNEGAMCQTLPELKAWSFKFYKDSMSPMTTGDLTRNFKGLLKKTTDPEFALDTESCSEEDPRDKVSLKGIIWKKNGKALYDHWLEFILQAKGLGQLYMAGKLYTQCLEDMYYYIVNAENSGCKKKKSKCEICGINGELLRCATCQKAVHRKCVGEEVKLERYKQEQKSKKGKWKCEECMYEVEKHQKASTVDTSEEGKEVIAIDTKEECIESMIIQISIDEDGKPQGVDVIIPKEETSEQHMIVPLDSLSEQCINVNDYIVQLSLPLFGYSYYQV